MGRREMGRKRSKAKFFVRFLPVLDFSLDSIKIESNSRVIHVKCLQNPGIFKKGQNKFWRFTADDIFWNASQDDVYASVCRDLVQKAIDGVNGVVVAYGQSGSGKTFTISGLRHHYEDRGILLRLLSSFCNERLRYCDLKKITISISYIEFLRSKTKDLFTNRFIEKFQEVRKREVIDEIDAWKSIFDAELHKSFDSKAPHAGSHRGNTVFTFHVEVTSLTESHPMCITSKVHVVDMSGIDSGNSPTTWRCPSDLGYSNLSKALMEQLMLCITGKTWKMAGCVCPFKTNKLLHYLREILQSHCQLRFVGHIVGSESNLLLTLSVLRFGETVQGFESAGQEDISHGDSLLTLRALEAEIERLRAELDLKDMLSNSPNYSNLSQEKLQEIRRAAKNFLLGTLDKLTLLNLGQAEITLDVFKEMYDKFAREKEQAVKEAVIAAIEEIQMQLPDDKTHGVLSLTYGPIRRASRRRSSRQQDSQTLPSEPIRLKVSETNMVVPGAAGAQVGQLDRKGISIGSRMNSPSLESPLAKALKKSRSRKMDTAARSAPRSNSIKDRALSPRDFTGADYSDVLPEKVPSWTEAWDKFVTERNDVIQSYQEEISKREESVRITRKNYEVALCELGKARDTLERTRKDWEDWKHVRHIRNGEEEEEEEEEDETFFKLHEERLQRREIELDNAAEVCHVTLTDLRNSVEELIEAKTNLENEFQMFCGDVYRIAVAPEDIPEWQFDTPTESIAEAETMDRIRREMYSQFRQKILNYVPKRQKTEWVKRF